MRFVAFFLSLTLTAALLYAMSIALPASGKKLPPLGSFFSPSEGFWQNAEPVLSIAEVSGSIKMDGLTDKVEVSFDDHAIPHIFAKNRADALRVQGYLTAKARLWQMDISSRKMAGRLAEVLGEGLIETDRTARRRGYVWAAENDLEGWSKFPKEMALLEAYTQGVNAYVEQLQPKDYPIEFKLLNYKPEPWSILKTAFVIESMAESLCFRNSDVEATTTRQALGAADFAMLFPEWNPKNKPIVVDYGQWNTIRRTDILKGDTSAALSFSEKTMHVERDADVSLMGHGDLAVWENPSLTESPVDKDYIVGSNNWALNGLKTASGHPMLCNDPHLKLTLPSIWYQLQLHTPEGNVSGVSLPGLPGIIIGFNEDVAWGVTNVGHDVLDWYQIDWTDSTRTFYRYGDGTEKADIRIEKIKVAGQETDIIDTVRYTVWGPVVYDDFKHPKGNMAMRWLAAGVPTTDEIGTFEQMNRAKDYKDYKNATKKFIAPAQNMVFASKTGDVAIRITGKLPLKKKGQGRFVQDGSDPDAAWQGFIPFLNMPFWKNPSRGFVFSANQHSTPPSYPYYYNGGFDDSRGRRIYERLTAMSEATVDSMKSIQLDNYNTLAADGLAAMVDLIEETQLSAQAKPYFEKIKAWDAQYWRESELPSLYEIWFSDVYEQTFDELYTLAETREIMFPDTWVLNRLLEEKPRNKWFDKQSTEDVSETAKSIVLESFEYAVEQAMQLSLTNALRWGAYKNFQVQHLGRIPAFGRYDLETDGSKQSPNAIGSVHGPSWRMVVDLKDEITAQAIYPGGQSGNPGSPYYDDMLEDWVEGKYYDVQIMQQPEGAFLTFDKP